MSDEASVPTRAEYEAACDVLGVPVPVRDDPVRTMRRAACLDDGFEWPASVGMAAQGVVDDYWSAEFARLCADAAALAFTAGPLRQAADAVERSGLLAEVKAAAPPGTPAAEPAAPAPPDPSGTPASTSGGRPAAPRTGGRTGRGG